MRGHTDLESNLIQLLLLQSETIPGLKQYVDDKQYLSPQILDEMIADEQYSVAVAPCRDKGIVHVLHHCRRGH